MQYTTNKTKYNNLPLCLNTNIFITCYNMIRERDEYLFSSIEYEQLSRAEKKIIDNMAKSSGIKNVMQQF